MMGDLASSFPASSTRPPLHDAIFFFLEMRARLVREIAGPTNVTGS
jgi:hypothetical protein